MSTETTQTHFVTAADLLAVIEPAEGGREIKDPATGDVVGRAPEHGVAELQAAVDTARAAQTGWATRSHDDRSEYLNRAAEAIEASAEALAKLLPASRESR